jgi:hypothetical protein
VYKPDVETKPTVVLPPPKPSTDQVTAVLLVFSTVVLNCCFCVNVTEATRGLIVTETAARLAAGIINYDNSHRWSNKSHVGLPKCCGGLNDPNQQKLSIKLKL